MSRFLTLIPYQTAISILSESADLTNQVKTVPVTSAVGYVTAEPAFARLTVPVCAVSQKDGFAVLSPDTLNATDSCPLLLSGYKAVNTGSFIPDEYDSVIALEDVRIIDEDRIEIIKPVRPGLNIKKAGSEIKTGTMVIPEGHYILPEDIGVLISCGCLNISARFVVAGIIPTGDELIEPFVAPASGEVIESNCFTIASYIKNLGIKPLLYPVTPDKPERIRSIIEQAVSECNFVIISGGTSAGTRDHTRAVMSELGTILFHGVAIRPGKTMLAGLIDNIPVFGLPGTPSGAFTILRELIIPWLKNKGYPVPVQSLIRVKLGESVPSDSGTDDFVMMMVGKVGEINCGISTGRGRGQFSTIHANGILHINREREGCEAGSIEMVRLFRSFPDPENVLLFTGVYDPILDYLDMILRRSRASLFLREGSLEHALLAVIKGNLLGGIIKRRYVCDEYKMKSDISVPPDLAYIITIGEREYISEEKTGLATKIEPDLLCSGQVYQSAEDIPGRVTIDLVIRDEFMNTPQVSFLKELLKSDRWREIINSLPGYSVEMCGNVTRI